MLTFITVLIMLFLLKAQCVTYAEICWHKVFICYEYTVDLQKEEAILCHPLSWVAQNMDLLRFRYFRHNRERFYIKWDIRKQ